MASGPAIRGTHALDINRRRIYVPTWSVGTPGTGRCSWWPRGWATGTYPCGSSSRGSSASLVCKVRLAYRCRPSFADRKRVPPPHPAHYRCGGRRRTEAVHFVVATLPHARLRRTTSRGPKSNINVCYVLRVSVSRVLTSNDRSGVKYLHRTRGGGERARRPRNRHSGGVWCRFFCFFF